MTEEPNIFDELASPGMSLRSRALEYAIQSLEALPIDLSPCDDDWSSGKQIEYNAGFRASMYVNTAKIFESYLKGDLSK